MQWVMVAVWPPINDLANWMREGTMGWWTEIILNGVNLRMQPLQCIVLSHGLDRLQSTIEQRNKALILDVDLRQINGIKHRRLNGYIETFALYMVLCERRDQLISYLHDNEIEAKIHYPLTLHQQQAAKQAANLIRRAPGSILSG